MVHQEVAALADGPDGIPHEFGHFYDLEQEAASQVEWDNTPKTVAFRNVSQLVAESLRFVQQAAGKAADIHRARRHEQDAAKGGGKAASSGGPPRARATASSGDQRGAWPPATPEHSQRRPRPHRPQSEPAKQQRRSKSREIYRPESHP